MISNECSEQINITPLSEINIATLSVQRYEYRYKFFTLYFYIFLGSHVSPRYNLLKCSQVRWYFLAFRESMWLLDL